MKITLSTVAVFSVISLLTGIVYAVPPKPLPPSAPPQPSSQQTEAFDLSLLVRVGTEFFQSDRYLTESQMIMRGNSQGVDFSAGMQLKTIVQTGKKFRTEIRFTKPGEAPKITGIVTSDGNRVTIYRPDLKQYAVISYSEFDKSDDSFLIGLSSSLFLELPEDSRMAIAQGGLGDKEVLKEIGLLDNPLIKGTRSTTPGENLYIYEYTEPKEAITFRAFIAPATATLNQIQFATKEQNLDIEITEKILSRTPNPTITPQTFKFIPPKTAKRVKTLSVSPF
ncbi:hypothetical protein [Calothrix sp. 336/3]|uniref:hypothetical protein n=1 Tax=Calothrix sp. 336/3 TaxID=1337936 RepID=UPI0004E3AF08|nr:hypothetical protein [Calothrix sp. 336/3]AKG23955.1 hypothetical protein IJ00_23975 [Calothrix sp. 336/3]